MAALPTLVPGGRLTSAVSSQISDASAALLIASEAAVRHYDLKPRARIHHLSARGADLVMTLFAPIEATACALQRTSLRIEDIDAETQRPVRDMFLPPVVMITANSPGCNR
jgi:acetyl-CoA C-acetyltransferase